MIDAPTFYENQARRKYREAAAKRPKCAWCGEPIFDDRAYRIDGNWVCKDCLEECEEYAWDDEEY